MAENEKKSSGAGKFFLGAALGAVAGAIAGVFMSRKSDSLNECGCDDDCDCHDGELAEKVEETAEKVDATAEKVEKLEKKAEKAEKKSED